MGDAKQAGAGEDNLLKLIQDAKSLTDDSDLTTKVNGRLYGELGDLVKYLNGMMKTVESVGSPMSTAIQELPNATDQLADVSRLTEEGTHRVLTYAEQMMQHHDQMSGNVGSLEKEIAENFPQREVLHKQVSEMGLLLDQDKKLLMDLMGALEFQDLAGQRLKKIGTVLQELQSRILKLMVVFGVTVQGTAMTTHKKEVLNELEEASAKSESLNQNLVDNILKEFGF